MPKRFEPPSQSRGKSDSPQDRQDKSRAANEARLAHFKVVAAAKVARERDEAERIQAKPIRDVEKFDAALLNLPLYQVGETQALHVSAAYRRLVAITLDVMNRGSREVALCWPSCDPSPAAIASLIALSDCAAAGPIKVGDYEGRGEPFGLRALIYPYARTAHRALRHLYADKDVVGRLQIQHQVRSTLPDGDRAFADYHRILARVRTLTGKGYDGKDYDELRHPCLDEVMPSGPCVGLDGRSQLLWRIGSKTDLRPASKAKTGITRTGEADDPTRARFYLFGLKEGVRVDEALKALADPLDVVFLDLDYTGRNRLGRNWLERTKRFLVSLNARFVSVPVLALTDDPYAFNALRFDALGTRAKKRAPAAPAPSAVVFSPRSEIGVAADVAPACYSNVIAWEVYGFAGESEALLAGLRNAARKSEALPDQFAAEHLRNLAAGIRRCVALPASLAQLSAYCSDEVGGLAAADLLAVYRVAPIVRSLRDSTGPFAQLYGDDLRALCDQAERVATNVNQITPMAPLLKDVVKRYARSSSRTVILFPNDMLADFAAHSLEDDPEIGQQVGERIDNGMLIFVHRAGLADLDALPPPQRNHIKRLIVVAPSRSALTALIAREWLPETMIVLSDADTLAGAVRDNECLAAVPELGALAGRMRGFVSRAAGTVEQVSRTIVRLDQSNEVDDELEFPLGGVVNLVGVIKRDQPFVEFNLEGGQVVIAKPGTRLVLHDRDRAVASFVEVEADRIEIGDRICVIGDAFVEMARPLLNISVRAAEEIRDYHALVLDRFAQLPGTGTADRLAEVVRRMDMADVSTQRASYWVDLAGQRDVPLHEVVPHAPRDFATFLRFLHAIGIGDAIAKRFWIWAVIAQRASRLRAAFSFHEAYRGILVDGYAAQSDNPTRVIEVRRLRAAAENFVAKVTAKKVRRGQDARA